MLSLQKSIRGFEPAFLVHITSVSLTFLVLQAFLEEKTCMVNLGYPESVCEALKTSKASEYPEESREVQKLIGKELSTRTMLENVFPIMLAFLLGPWSDKYGRKLPLLMVIMGFLVQALILAGFAYFDDAIGAWPVALTSSVILSISGNQQCFMMASFSHVSETVRIDNMTLRISILQSFLYLGFFLGLTGSGLLIQSGIGFFSIFILLFSLELFAFFYLVFMMDEVPRGFGNGKSVWQIFMELFDLSLVVDTLKSIFRRREGTTRIQLTLLLFAHSCTLVPMFGEYAVSFLYSQFKFNVDVATFGTFMSYTILVGLLSNFIGAWVLSDFLNLSDNTIGIVGIVSGSLSSLVYAFANSWKTMYAGPIVSILAGPSLSIPRTMISKIVPANELGKFNCFISSLESIIPFVASPIYAFTYAAFIDVFPGSFFIISAVCSVPSIFIYWWISKNQIDRRED